MKEKKKNTSIETPVKDEGFKEIPREFDFDDEMIKHVVILNPSKEAAAWERFFNSFPEWMGRENHKFRDND
ncbi:hypothetical protein CLPUN_49310 [Clostridium puniceum]|uniref:Uncharacterized protein n=1 Tax=Clostridium puniceum TaxID=29367 RepID=A0A1S8T1H3_9CLOT|nr:hypothetical protein [Clostridium puniceum]OOM71464.1 hypothetical protein CLPUN_49310 [Clostridium puniceum]